MLDDETIQKFKERIDRLEKRYKGCNFADHWLVPKEELIAVRDALKDERRVRPDLQVRLF